MAGKKLYSLEKPDDKAKELVSKLTLEEQVRKFGVISSALSVWSAASPLQVRFLISLGPKDVSQCESLLYCVDSQHIQLFTFTGACLNCWPLLFHHRSKYSLFRIHMIVPWIRELTIIDLVACRS
jgi:hypothetical protein